MRLTDLTMPLYEGMGTGYQHRSLEGGDLWDTQVKIRKGWNYETHGRSIWSINVFLESGTRLVLASFQGQFKDSPRIHQVMTKYFMRDAVILDIPKGAEEVVTAEDVERAYSKVPAQKGDAIMVRTGWGDNERYLKMGRDYHIRTPHYINKSAQKIGEIMESLGSDLFLYDTSNMIGLNPETGEREGLLPFRPHWAMLGGLVNCGAIQKQRVKIAALPFKVLDAGISLCSVVAVEE
ncbi:MAG: cyclase family protein [Chloroflexi bacterium]|nr:cyclase family protein [Chloroflexota bacterium]